MKPSSTHAPGWRFAPAHNRTACGKPNRGHLALAETEADITCGVCLRSLQPVAEKC